MIDQQATTTPVTEKTKEKVVEKIADLLEERKGERRQSIDVPEYIHSDLDRRKNDRRDN